MWCYQSYQSLAVTLLQDVPEEPSLTMVSGGARLGEHEGMFGGPSFDIASRLQETNTLVVLVAEEQKNRMAEVQEVIASILNRSPHSTRPADSNP